MTRCTPPACSRGPHAARARPDRDRRDRRARGQRAERLHREAALLLAAGDTSPPPRPPHLLECEPHGDPEVSGLLARAAADATRRGEPRAAAGHLERALQEGAAADDRGRLLARLAAAAFDAGRPDARRRLHEALSELDDPAAAWTS